MSSLSDLITKRPELSLPLSTSAAMQTQAIDTMPQAALPFLDQAEAAIISRDRIWAKVSLLVLILKKMYIREPEPGFLEMLVRAKESEDGYTISLQILKRSLQQIREEINYQDFRARRELATGSLGDALSFLDYLWGPELPEILAQISGCQTATTRGWMRGQRPSPLNELYIRTLAEKSFEELENGNNDLRSLLCVASSVQR